MKSYEHSEAVKASQENRLDSAMMQQDDGSWIMSLKNPNGEISVVTLPDVD